MSRTRTRPTREDTRRRLFLAAAQVFEEKGIGAASVDAIAAAAGFSRGAFYSNFDNMDELIIAMFHDHAERSLRHHRDMVARHGDSAELVAALEATERGRDDPLGRAPILYMELTLFLARAEKRRPELAEHLRASRAAITEIVTATRGVGGPDRKVDPIWAGAMLLALQDGFRLHRLIDPDTTSEDSFLSAVSELQRLINHAT